MNYKGESHYPIARIEGSKAVAVLCADGRRRTARLYFDNPWTDSESIAASVKVKGLTVMGALKDAKPVSPDLHFYAFQYGSNANLLPAVPAESYRETLPVVYSVIQSIPGYMPNDDSPPLFRNRKEAESYAADEKRRYLDDMWIGETEEQYVASGSARDGSIHIERKDNAHDLGWTIEVVEIFPCDLSPEERNELLENEPYTYQPVRNEMERS